MSLNFYIKQNDTSPTIRATLKGAGNATLNLSGASVYFRMKRSSGDTLIEGAAEIFDPTEGTVQYAWEAGDTSVAGTYKAEFELTYSDGKVETFPNLGSISITITPEID